jgi:hypothetical protein
MFQKLARRESDLQSVTRFLVSEDPAFTDEVWFNETNFVMHPTVTKMDAYGKPRPLNYFEDTEARQHIEIRYALKTIDHLSPYPVD